jgi:23S rRNA (uridine2552-2'-O)-methyltransferase
MLHRRGVGAGADLREQRFASITIIAEHPDLDELVRLQRDIDFVQHRRCETVLTDEDHGLQRVRTGTQLAPVRGSQGIHAGILPGEAGKPATPRGARRSMIGLMAGPKATRKQKFVKAWVQEHVNDHWVKEATRLGYRSRAAFKLIELAEKDKLFRPGIRVVDLGSAPGSWTQVLREKLGGKSEIVAVDLLPMDPIRGVAFIQGDFREDEGLAAVEAALAGRKVDLVLSDLAPNLSGVEAADQARAVHLGELALEFTQKWLQPGGDLVVKPFQGSGFVELQRAIQGFFEKVHVRKPKASRDRSREVYLVAKGFLGSSDSAGPGA